MKFADRRGNRVLLVVNVANIFVYLLTKAYYIWRNKQNSKQWNALSKEVSATVR